MSNLGHLVPVIPRATKHINTELLATTLFVYDSHSRPSFHHRLIAVHMALQLCDCYGKKGVSKEGEGGGQS